MNSLFVMFVETEEMNLCRFALDRSKCLEEINTRDAAVGSVSRLCLTSSGIMCLDGLTSLTSAQVVLHTSIPISTTISSIGRQETFFYSKAPRIYIFNTFFDWFCVPYYSYYRSTLPTICVINKFITNSRLRHTLHS